MPHDISSQGRTARRTLPTIDRLEDRALLSGAASSTAHHASVSIEVPGEYISQQSSQLDVTLVRTTRAGKVDARGPLTVAFTATPAATASGVAATPSASGPPASFRPVDETVTFPAGQASQTVAIPILQSTASPSLVPIQLAVSTSSRKVSDSSATVYLASSSDAIPPTIIGARRVAGGFALTFSKPMDPATVENIHNYALKFSPSQNFSLENIYGIGLVNVLNTAKQHVPLRRATYDPSSNTVLLVAGEQLGSKGSYEITSAASLTAKKGGPHKAQPLTDLAGNMLNQGEAGGAFSVSISKGKPFAVDPPTLEPGS